MIENIYCELNKHPVVREGVDDERLCKLFNKCKWGESLSQRMTMTVESGTPRFKSRRSSCTYKDNKVTQMAILHWNMYRTFNNLFLSIFITNQINWPTRRQ